MAESIIPSTNLEEDLARYIQMGYRLDMIMPADAPRAAVVSRPGESIRLETNGRENHPLGEAPTPLPGQDGSFWVQGRAGMMYRDLIPGRAGGKVVASHIRLAKDGPVSDYVHYHKVEFQMIYCIRGRIRVVYEDQGPPFWLEAGDCVLQPPEIRHRVLESMGQAEVVEASVPAVHETWVEHEIELPTSRVRSEREFSGQRFVRHIAAKAEWLPDPSGGFAYSDTGICDATGGVATVRILRALTDSTIRSPDSADREQALTFYFVLDGELETTAEGQEQHTLVQHEGILSSGKMDGLIFARQDTEFLEISYNNA